MLHILLISTTGTAAVIFQYSHTEWLDPIDQQLFVSSRHINEHVLSSENRLHYLGLSGLHAIIPKHLEIGTNSC